MSVLSDRIDAAAKAIDSALVTLKADAANAEAYIQTQAQTAAQQAISTYMANSQDLIASIKAQAVNDLTLARQELQAEKQAALAAQQAEFNQQIADLKAQIAALTK